MYIFGIQAPPIEQQGDLEAYERQIATFAIGRSYPFRLLAFSRPFPIDQAKVALHLRKQTVHRYRGLHERLMPLLYQLLHDGEGHTTEGVHAELADAVDALSAHDRQVLHEMMADRPAIMHAPTLASESDWLLVGERLASRTWTLPIVRDMETMYDDVGHRALRSAQYALMVWPPAEVQSFEVQTSIQMAFRCEVQLLPSIPAIITGPMRAREQQSLLAPVQPGHPFLSIMRSHAILGDIDASVLHPLMALPFNVTIAIDVETVSSEKARRQAEFAFQAARAALRNTQVKDTRSEDKLVDAERVMREIRTQSLHQVQIAILVEGSSADEVRSRRAAVRDLLSSTLRCEAFAGSQEELLKLFTTIPAKRIDAAWRRSSMLSHGVGCLFGITSFYRSRHTDGPFWGIDAYRHAPLFYNIFAEGKAGHTVVLGQTGCGKTFFLNVMTMRVAATMGWRVIWIDSENNGVRLERACGDGCRRYPIGPDTRLNVLDPVYGEDDGPQWIYGQIAYVISSLEMLLGTPISSGTDVIGMEPRSFTPEERGCLERALLAVYAPSSAPDEGEEGAGDPPPPILTDLILALEELEEPLALGIAQSLRMVLFGSATRMDTQTLRGACFNGATSEAWNLDQDVTVFDLTDQSNDKSLIPFRYAHIIGMIYRYMRDARRDRKRPTLLIIDEFGLASRITAVGQLAATITRVARKYGLALVLADQTPQTFLKTDFGRVILENSPIKFLFHMEKNPTQEIGEALPILTPTHLDFITQHERAACVAVFNAYASPMHVYATVNEERLLEGS
ncbi:MAG: hypothetical protein EI684_22245 [Candidatus Viridilinea halotolerans]|uniref:TraG P-loop domain-containing protein n=1 Tax=Candidatus Viridilinea halotolerans TaxID=2491704 RepID=A0A426TQX4_9CHLR|nr:MAG: hypothetical protein EI684_22245 [Candidatus Viridilinea halotolerans]